MNPLKWLQRRFAAPRPPDNAALASLILAARGDADFCRRLLFVLRLPQNQREPLLRTAIEQMALRGEPPDVRMAFAALGTEEGARAAIRLLEQSS